MKACGSRPRPVTMGRMLLPPGDIDDALQGSLTHYTTQSLVAWDLAFVPRLVMLPARLSEESGVVVRGSSLLRSSPRCQRSHCPQLPGAQVPTEWWSCFRGRRLVRRPRGWQFPGAGRVPFCPSGRGLQLMHVREDGMLLATLSSLLNNFQRPGDCENLGVVDLLVLPR